MRANDPHRTENRRPIVAILRSRTATDTDVVCMNHGLDARPRPGESVMTKENVSELASWYAEDGEQLRCDWCGGDLPGASPAEVEAWFAAGAKGGLARDDTDAGGAA